MPTVRNPGSHLPGVIMRLFCAALLTWQLVPAPARAQDPDALALAAPVDTSSPSSTLNGFIASSGRLAAMVTDRNRGASKRDEKIADDLTDQAASAIDLSDMPPAILDRSKRERVLMLYDSLRRISTEALAQAPKDAKQAAWLVPGTPIRMVRIADGDRSGEYVFSAATIDSIDDIHARAVTRAPAWGGGTDSYPVLVANLGATSPPLIKSAVDRLPDAFLIPHNGNAIWQWLAFAAVILIASGAVVICVLAMRRVKPGNAFGQLLASGVPIIVTRIAAFASLNAIDALYLSETVHWLANAVLLSIAYAAWVWWLVVVTVWLSANLPQHLYPDHSVKAAVTRLGLRFCGIVITGIVFARGLEQVGVPMYGIVASLGVGGLALALAAQPTVENLLAGIILFVDQPARVGDECEFDGIRGIVEEIGIRSTTVRLHDGTLLTLTNSEFCNMKIRNLGVGHYQFSLDLPLANSVSVDVLGEFIEASRTMLQQDADIVAGSVKVEIDAISAAGVFIKLSGKFNPDVPDPNAAWQKRQLDILGATQRHALPLATPA